MADHTHIEWADATWNPITGCTVLSSGCGRCYAMRLAGGRLRNHPSRAGLTTMTSAGPVWNGEVRFNADVLAQPLRWRAPRGIFVCAHGDLFHESIPDPWIDLVFAVMTLAPQHTFYVLTKRSARMRDYLSASGRREAITRTRSCMCTPTPHDPPGHDGRPWTWPLRNVWLGVSVEDQANAAARIPDLLATPAAVRWISAEPLLGPIDLTKIVCLQWYRAERVNALTGDLSGILGDPAGRTTKLDWVIAGGESGAGARPMHPDWPRALRDQCAAAGVPFFFKQWGAWVSVSEVEGDGPHHSFPNGATVRRVGKKLAGRRLDGIEHNDRPERKTA